MHFHYKTYTATTKQKNLNPRGDEIFIIGIPLLGHFNYALNLSDICPRVDKKILKEIMHFHNMNYMATLWHMNPCPGCLET